MLTDLTTCYTSEEMLLTLEKIFAVHVCGRELVFRPHIKGRGYELAFHIAEAALLTKMRHHSALISLEK